LKQVICILFTFCFCSACKNPTGVSETEETKMNTTIAENRTHELMPIDYVKWVKEEKNGISKSKTIDDVKYILQYKPHDYLACMEFKSDTVRKNELVKKEEEFKGMVYFDFKIHIPDGYTEFLKYGISSASEYQQRVNYCAFNMQYEISIIQNADTIPCTMYLFERAYDVMPEGTFLLGFDERAIDANKEMTFLFNDKLFRKGYVKFTFEPKTLINIPKLKTV
jgi:hypothetical protein